VNGPERTPATDGTADQQMAAPSVSTAPARPGPFSRIPSHLGRARTSTVVLGLLFVSIFALYLTIKPADPGTAAGTTETGTEQPAPVPAPATTAPETPAEPTTEPETTSAPTSTSGTTTEEEPSDTTVPEETSAPTTSTTTPTPTSREATPTSASPTG